MSTRMTINGVSTCTQVGTEKYEKSQTYRQTKRTLMQYDYRHTDGELSLCETHVRRVPGAARDMADGKGKKGGQAMNEGLPKR